MDGSDDVIIGHDVIGPVVTYSTGIVNKCYPGFPMVFNATNLLKGVLLHS